MRFINSDMILNPWNWAVVLLMTLIAIFLFVLVDPLRPGVLTDPASSPDNT